MAILSWLSGAGCQGCSLSARSPVEILSDIGAYLDDHLIAQARYMILVRGFLLTIYLTVTAFAIGTVIGTLICLSRLSKRKWLARLATGLNNFIKQLPTLVFLVLFIEVVFAGLAEYIIGLVLLAFSIRTGSYMSDIILSAVQAVDRAQVEAGRALGMSGWTALWLITLPQAFTYARPFLKDQIFTTMMFTPLASFFAVPELTTASQVIISQTGDPWLALILVMAVYLGFALLIDYLFNLPARRHHLRSTDFL